MVPLVFSPFRWLNRYHHKSVSYNCALGSSGLRFRQMCPEDYAFSKYASRCCHSHHWLYHAQSATPTSPKKGASLLLLSQLLHLRWTNRKTFKILKSWRSRVWRVNGLGAPKRVSGRTRCEEKVLMILLHKSSFLGIHISWPLLWARKYSRDLCIDGTIRRKEITAQKFQNLLSKFRNTQETNASHVEKMKITKRTGWAREINRAFNITLIGL